MSRIIKAKHTGGVHYTGSYFMYIGDSRIDGYPMYSCELEAGEAINWGYHLRDFIFNGMPHYIPKISDFEPVSSLEEGRFSLDDLVSVQPMSAPTGTLYYLDYVYDDMPDKRLLLLM